MPSAPKIRKEILHILESSILPALREKEILQVLAAPPFDFSQVTPQILQEEFLPDNDEGPLQMQRHWPKEGLVAARGINFSFCYAGEMHKKIGVTQKVGQELLHLGQPQPAGITLIKLPSPSITVASPFTAREAHTNQVPLNQDTASTLSIICEREAIYVYHSERSPQLSTGSHLLSIQDAILHQLLKLYYEALALQTDAPGTQALLYAVYMRLHYQLEMHRPVVSNSSWLAPAQEMELTLTHTQSKYQTLCHEIIDYIQNHLHTPLSIELLAAHFNISAFHLNRVFRTVQNTTVMHYVTELRIKAAQRILTQDKEQIKEIAQLVGFSSVTSFCTVFRRHTGLTPNQYRKRHLKSE
jgi:AraC-like DNA-binding protein